MSPLTLRRYRAERLLRKEFEGLRGRVIATVRGRLGAGSVGLDASDLDACYAQAWQGLYAALLNGEEIANPAGWLTLVTFRRAIEELRSQQRACGGHGQPGRTAEEPDFAAELDDRMKLRQLFEGLRGRLSAREREAAAFCYLQGLSRSEAAARMGLSESRMRKLMDGGGAGRPGVAGKVGELAETIRAGGWCEEQGSLMRGLAYGILDPSGERYRLALSHSNECPACRAYVSSLRGLAAALPPVLLPWGLGVGALARGGAAGHAGASIGAHPAVGAQAAGGVGAGTQAGAGIGGTLTASGAASVGGAAGGTWLLAGGPLGAKLAVGCVIALGVGAGCVALSDGPFHPRAPVQGRGSARVGNAGSPGRDANGAPGSLLSGGELAGGVPVGQRQGAAAGSGGISSRLSSAQQAAREFGPEGALAAVVARSLPSAGRRVGPAARSASSGSGSPNLGRSPTREFASGGSPSSPSPAAGSTHADASAAQREFGIG